MSPSKHASIQTSIHPTEPANISFTSHSLFPKPIISPSANLTVEPTLEPAIFFQPQNRLNVQSNVVQKGYLYCH